MAIDASIYGNVGRGVRSVADYDKDRAELAAQGQAKEINALALLTGRQKYDETARANQEQEALRSLLGDPSFDRRSPDATARLYRTAPGAAAGVVKGWQQQDKAQADLDEQLLKTANDAAKLHRSQLDAVTDAKSYAAWLDAGYKDPVLGKIMARSGDLQSKLQAIPQDPAEFRKLLLQQAAGLEKFTELTKPKIETRNTGGTTDTLAIDPLTGQVKVANSVTNTQSPDSVASNARMAAEGAANRSVQMRGQDKVDARQRDLNTITKEDKEAARKEAANEKAVTKFSDTLQKEGIPEIEAALKGAEGIFAKYTKDGKLGDVPGIGPVKNALPDWAVSSEGKDVRESMQAVANIVLSARSGAAVTDQELRRLARELSNSVGADAKDMQRAYGKFRTRFETVKQNAAAGVSDAVKNTYEDRGGVKIKRGNEAPEKQIKRTGTLNGRKVVEYTDGSVEYKD